MDVYVLPRWDCTVYSYCYGWLPEAAREISILKRMAGRMLPGLPPQVSLLAMKETCAMGIPVPMVGPKEILLEEF